MKKQKKALLKKSIAPWIKKRGNHSAQVESGATAPTENESVNEETGKLSGTYEGLRQRAEC